MTVKQSLTGNFRHSYRESKRKKGKNGMHAFKYETRTLFLCRDKAGSEAGSEETSSHPYR